VREGEINRLKRKMGELTMDLDSPREATGSLRRRGRPMRDRDAAQRLDARRVCRVLQFSRARLRSRAVIAAAPPWLDEVLAERIKRLIELHPTLGYRRLRAKLHFVEGSHVNRKSVFDCGCSRAGSSINAR
jgi:hypothetical protein